MDYFMFIFLIFGFPSTATKKITFSEEQPQQQQWFVKGHKEMEAMLKLVGQSNGQRLANARKHIETAIIDHAVADEKNIERRADQNFIRLWAKHRLFREALDVQRKTGENYCKGKQHYESNNNYQIGNLLRPLEMAIAGMEKFVGANVNIAHEKEDKALLENAIKLMKRVGQLDKRVNVYYQGEKAMGLDKETDSLVKGYQVAIDTSIGEMAAVVGQEVNPFEQLVRAEQLLALAAKLWNAIVEYNTGKDVNNQQHRQNKYKLEAVVAAYNAFAFKWEAFLAYDGLNQEKPEKINMAKLKQMVAASQNNHAKKQVLEELAPVQLAAAVNAHFLSLVRQLLTAYSQLRLPHMDVPKIRGDGHSVLSIGPIEYDLTGDKGLRRRIFKYQLDEYISECSPRKARPISNTGPVKLSEADSVFYQQMVPHGWTEYSRETGRICYTFVWNFLCILFKGECPQKKDLPLNFLETVGAVFEPSKFTIKNSADVFNNCRLEPLDIDFHLLVKGNEKSGNNHQLDQLLPIVVEYKVGKYRRSQEADCCGHQQVVLGEMFTDQQQMGEVVAEQPARMARGVEQQQRRRHFKAQLMVYSCKLEEDEDAVGGRKEVAYVQEICIVGKELESNKVKNIQLKLAGVENAAWLACLDNVDLKTNNVILMQLS